MRYDLTPMPVRRSSSSMPVQAGGVTAEIVDDYALNLSLCLAAVARVSHRRRQRLPSMLTTSIQGESVSSPSLYLPGQHP